MIFLTGPHGAGKTEAAKALKSLGFQCIELGETIRRKWKKASRYSFDLWCKNGEKKNGPHFTDKLLVNEIKKYFKTNNNEKIVLVGSRSYGGIKYLISSFSKNNKNIIIYIFADLKKLKDRCESRDKKNFTKKEFISWLKKDKEIGIESIRVNADFIIINNSSRKDLYKKILRVLIKSGYFKKHDKKQ